VPVSTLKLVPGSGDRRPRDPGVNRETRGHRGTRGVTGAQRDPRSHGGPRGSRGQVDKRDPGV